MAEAEPNKPEVIMRTENPVHEGDFKWIIDHASKFCRRLQSSKLENDCNPEFQLVAKFNERYPEAHVTNVNVGLQRIDADAETVHVSVDVQLLNTNGDQYCRKESSFTCSSGGPPFYIFSELFSDSVSKLTLYRAARSVSSDDDHELLILKAKNLMASHGNVGRIFILPDDVLIIKGHIKVFGCCVVTKKIETPRVETKLTPQSHVDQLLLDFTSAYENGVLADVELLVGDQTIKAHKFVLQARSSVFRRMFRYNTKEQEDGTIEVTDVDFPILEALVSYLYTGIVRELSYDDACDLYEAADKYEVFRLQKACSEILKTFISVDTVCRIVVLADMHNDAKLKDDAIRFISYNFAKVKKTVEWELTVSAHQKIASDVLARVCLVSDGTIPEKR